MAETKIVPLRSRGSLHVSVPCPRCDEDFHVFEHFVPERSASRFLWWTTPARAAHWIVDCSCCGYRYAVTTTEATVGRFGR